MKNANNLAFTMNMPICPIVLSPVRTHDRTHKGKSIDLSDDRTAATSPSTQLVGGFDDDCPELSMLFESKSSKTRPGIDSRESQVDKQKRIEMGESKKSELETSLLMSTSFRQFAPSLVTKVKVSNDVERKAFDDTLHDSLARFGLNKLAVEKRYFCVALVNSVNVRNSDPVSIHNSEPINVRNADQLPVRSDQEPFPSIRQTGKDRSPKPLHRRKRKSGTVLCLMPLPDDARSTCETYRTSRSAPATTGDQRFSACASQQHYRECDDIEFRLAPRDPLSRRSGLDLYNVKSRPPLTPTRVSCMRHENSADSRCSHDMYSAYAQSLPLQPDIAAFPLSPSDCTDASRFGLGQNSRSNTRPIVSGQKVHETKRVSPISPTTGKSEKKGIFKKLFSYQGKCSFSHNDMSLQNGFQVQGNAEQK
jgi:hypothetical protein